MDEQDNTVNFFRFEELRIYAKALDYIEWLHKEMAFSEHDGCSVILQESFIKSAHGIALNTAEGSSRNKTQFLYYLKMAKSSVRECVVFTEIAFRRNLLNAEAKMYSRNQLMELTKMIGSLIASLQRNTGGQHEARNEPEPTVEPMPELL